MVHPICKTVCFLSKLNIYASHSTIPLLVFTWEKLKYMSPQNFYVNDQGIFIPNILTAETVQRSINRLSTYTNFVSQEVSLCLTHSLFIHTAVGSLLFIAKWKESDTKTIYWRIQSRKGTTTVTETTSECSAIGGVDRKHILGTMKMPQVMIMLEVTWIHTFVPTCRIVDLKPYPKCPIPSLTQMP